MEKYLPLLAAFLAFVFLCVVSTLFYSSYTRGNEQIAALREQAEELHRKSAAAEEKIAYLNLYIDHLLKDNEFREMEARRHAGMAIEGEVIIREEKK